MSRREFHLVFGSHIWLDVVPKTNSLGKKYYEYRSMEEFLQSFVEEPCLIRESGDLKKSENLEYYLTFPVPNELTWLQLDQWMTELTENTELQQAFQQSLKNLGQDSISFEQLKIVPVGTFC